MLGFDALGRLALGQISRSGTTTMAAVVGAFALSGQASIFRVSMAEAAGSFALTGSAASLTRGMPASAASFALAGQAALFRVSMLEAAASFALSGPNAILTAGLRCGTGEFNVTGQEIILFLGMLTNTDLLQMPVDYYMEGLPQYRDLGRTFERMKGEAGENVTLKAGARGRLSKAASGFTSRTDSRGYD